jgi:chemotaxis response regulator CheB
MWWPVCSGSHLHTERTGGGCVKPCAMGKKVGVLVVDDSPICLQLISDALRRDPELDVVGTAANGREAVELTRSLKPNVITMDVDMPVMDGLAATEQIMAETPTPILMLTADPRNQAPELTCKALELGALALQVKPAMDASLEAWARHPQGGEAGRASARRGGDRQLTGGDRGHRQLHRRTPGGAQAALGAAG